MATWHFVLYSAAAILALRSFIQLVTNYRNEFEHATVKNHLTKMADELKKDSEKSASNVKAESVAAKPEKQAATT